MQTTESKIIFQNGAKYLLMSGFNPITDEIVGIFWCPTYAEMIHVGSLYYANEQLPTATEHTFKIPLPVIEYARDLAEIYLENNKHLEKQNDNA